MFSSIDLHGYTKQEAKVQLDHLINNLSKGHHEVTVIHGYSSSILQTYIQRQYNHKRVVHKILTMNKGETILVIE